MIRLGVAALRLHCGGVVGVPAYAFPGGWATARARSLVERFDGFD